jgi:feruloyl esterase
MYNSGTATSPSNASTKESAIMRQPSLGLAGLVLGFVTLAPATLRAQLPTCAQLNIDAAFGLAGNPVVIQHTTTLVPASLGNPAYCRVDFVVSERGGPAFGYADGEIQRIGLRVGLPANSADGGTGGGPDGEGAWNGKVRNLGGGGLVGALSPVTVATNARYVGSFTDTGHFAAEGAAFGVIQPTHELNLGKIEDFFSESIRLQYQWALRLANTYYGKPAIRNYWDGCNTGGRQGLVLAALYGDDFDGFLIGAPHTNHSRTSSAGTWRGWVNLEMTGGSVSAAKIDAAVNRMIAACDAQDGVVDGMLSEPRTCQASAALNICGEPGAPTGASCLTALEAAAIDRVMDGPRNDLGHRVWFPFGRGSAAQMNVGIVGTGGNAIFGWANKDLTYDYRTHPLSDWDDVHELGTQTVGPFIDMGSPNLDLTKDNGGKILMWHGLADQTISWQQNVYYYDQVVDRYQGVEHVTPWFRFFLAPGVSHYGGGIGPQPQNLFNTLINWVESGAVPDSILASGGGRTRPLCPFPQTAIYDGVGNPNLASSFQCGGNIETKQAKCDALVVKYQHETGTAYETLGGEDDLSCGLAFPPVTTASLSPPPVNGWYHNPSVTLAATDRDSDLDRSEYRLDGGPWLIYSGPFQVIGDGQHIFDYRSVDKVGHVEATHTLAFAIDATPPEIEGMPASCAIWPPNDKLVQIAVVTASDAGSGVAPGSLAVNVSSNESITGDDILIAGTTVHVRASRSALGRGRIYTLTAHVTDVAGNVAQATAACTVPHDQAKKGK